MKKLILVWASCLFTSALFSQNIKNNPGSNHGNDFEQLGTILPSPNEYRTAGGAPGPKYWQQKADYHIKCTLDEKALKLTGSEEITYHNNSPDPLEFLWLQLDENQHSRTQNAGYESESTLPRMLTTQALDNVTTDPTPYYGVNITLVKDAEGKNLPYIINKTMMRIDLPKPLAPGEKLSFRVDWNYMIPDRMGIGGRGGFEHFKDHDNYLFTMTQWFPRMCVYSDFEGWQNHQFSGRAEFALAFGDYKVEMTVPADHIVTGTGECQNYPEVLTKDQMERWKKAQTASEPVQIVTLDEATKAEKQKSDKTKTWVFAAKNVRDFAWTSSRKFCWDAMPIEEGGHKVMCMSFYPKESYHLYQPYSTKVVAHTIKTYSHFSIPYPYPVAQSIEASNGMEYPMICFNFGRTEEDGTYSEGTKNGMIGVIIHEVGHNFFPMIINSDERQWTWLDEGVNSFVEYLTEELWDNKFPVRKGPAYTITDYMKLPKDELEPIMTNSDNIVRFGPNAYSKPATGLNILRETIMGRDLFDKAFRTYCQRWEFKHPTPADFFRTMEEASGEDLDWFWRGWFYGTDPVDISLDSVKVARPDLTAVVSKPREFERKLDEPAVNSFDDISKQRNREDKNITFATDRDTTLRDFYWKYDRGIEPYDSTVTNKISFDPGIEEIPKKEQKKYEDINYYELHFSNKGGMIMPIIIEWTYADGSKEVTRIPAQIWRHNEKNVVKTYAKTKEVVSIKLDPMRETADIDESNNVWGVMPAPSSIKAFKLKKNSEPLNRRNPKSTNQNPMQHSMRT